MNAWVKYFVFLGVRYILKLCWIFPVKKNKIVEYTYGGKQYSCSAKYITERILKERPEKYEIIWAFNDPSKFERVANQEGFKTVKFKSIRFFWNAVTAGVFICNGLPTACIPFRKSQFVLSTWHGGGAYKKNGLDTIDNFPQRRLAKMMSNSLTKLTSSCQKFSENFHRAYYIPYDKYVNYGLPRNDMLVNQDRPDLYKKIKGYYHIPDDTKILLYAPTFRSNMGSVEDGFHKGDYSIDIARLRNSLTKRFGGKWCIMFRAHYYLSSDVTDKTVVDATDYSDMQELLYVADILITDYSSSMWDFSLTYKPCFLFAADLNQYEHDRDFYTPIERWPFPLAQNNDELEDNILAFDEKKYKEDVDRHHKELGSFESGKACETICKMIYDFTDMN